MREARVHPVLQESDCWSVFRFFTSCSKISRFTLLEIFVRWSSSGTLITARLLKYFDRDLVFILQRLLYLENQGDAIVTSRDDPLTVCALHKA